MDKISNQKMQLLQLLKEKALKKGEFVLSSGKKSNYYLDGRIITLTPEGAYLVADIILELIKHKNIDAIGGPTLGADPITGAIAALSYIKKIPLKTFIVRKAAKVHGAGRQIEGPELKSKDRVILVDDVATTGGALLEAASVLKQEGVQIEEAIVIVDREEGAEQSLAKEGIRLSAIFKLEDLGL
ncbi:MAG: orotate phosphoribosyltransferase [Candidatus Omnitrophota bacterium]